MKLEEAEALYPGEWIAFRALSHLFGSSGSRRVWDAFLGIRTAIRFQLGVLQSPLED